MSKTLYIIIFLLVAASVVWYLWYGFAPPESAPREIIGQQESAPSPNLDATTTDGLEVTTFQSKEGEFTAEANRSYQDGIFRVGIRVKNLSYPGEGKFYGGWLRSRTDAKTKTIYIGPLTRAKVGGDYVVGYSRKEDLRSYQEVLVTLEAKDDENPEKTILEGSFK